MWHSVRHILPNLQQRCGGLRKFIFFFSAEAQCFCFTGRQSDVLALGAWFFCLSWTCSQACYTSQNQNDIFSCTVSTSAKFAGVAAASLTLAAAANAVTVKMGSSSGALVFEPASVTVKAGETITFVNNVGFPHNVVFDEDEVPAGVKADAISHDDYFNAPGETYDLKLDKAGTYGFYCEPHQGAGMAGTITVN